MTLLDRMQGLVDDVRADNALTRETVGRAVSRLEAIEGRLDALLALLHWMTRNDPAPAIGLAIAEWGGLPCFVSDQEA